LPPIEVQSVEQVQRSGSVWADPDNRPDCEQRCKIAGCSRQRTKHA
jgi:hypothetical protein